MKHEIEQDPGLMHPIEAAWRKAGFRLGGEITMSNPTTIYMVRWVLLRIFGLELRVNLFLSSDQRCLHDHPASFISVILLGYYHEVTENGTKLYKAGNILYRPARWRHRLIIEKPVLTINLVSKRTRNWGFWTTSKKWIPWREFNSENSDC